MLNKLLIMKKSALIFFVMLIVPGQNQNSLLLAQTYLWLSDSCIAESDNISDIPVPDGFARQNINDGSFAHWLRSLPLKEARTRVTLFDGRLKSNQNVHHRIINIDVGSQDLQQCADAVIRLRSEYLYDSRQFEDIHFNFTSGDTCHFQHWSLGYRPKITGNLVTWKQSARPDSGYTSFRKYLNTIFTYSGSYSLSSELDLVDSTDDIRIGDIYIQGGFPGHAVIIVDLAIDLDNGAIAILLAQSYMPAQDIHILNNPGNTDIGPWYIIGDSERLETPEWVFDWTDLKRFPESKN